MVAECFVERSREAATDVDVVVTNHSFMAIDAFEGRQMLPEHDVLVVDEGHELVDRVTSTITDELTPGMVRAASKRAGRQADATEALDDAGDPPRVGPRADARGPAHRRPRRRSRWRSAACATSPAPRRPS